MLTLGMLMQPSHGNDGPENIPDFRGKWRGENFVFPGFEVE